MAEIPIPPTLRLDTTETRCKRCGIEAEPGWLVPDIRSMSELGKPVSKYCLECWTRRARKLTSYKRLVGRDGIRVFTIASIVMAVSVIIFPLLNAVFSFVLLPIMLKLISQCNNYPEDAIEIDRQHKLYKQNLDAFREAKSTGSIMGHVACARHRGELAVARCIRCGEALCIWCLIYESLDGYKDIGDLARMDMIRRASRSHTSAGSIANAIVGGVITAFELLQLPPAAMITHGQRAMYGKIKDMVPKDLQDLYTTGVHQLVLRSLADQQDLLRSFNSITFECPEHKDMLARLARRKTIGYYLPRIVAITFIPYTLASVLMVQIFTPGGYGFLYAMFLPCVIGGLIGCMSNMYRKPPLLDMLFGQNPLKKNPEKFNNDVYRLIDVLANDLLTRLRREFPQASISLCPVCGQLEEASTPCETCKILNKLE